MHRTTRRDPCTTSSTNSPTTCTATHGTAGIAFTAVYAVDAPVKYQAIEHKALSTVTAVAE
eukprot:9223025-Karenia_brevis.AAC.1